SFTSPVHFSHRFITISPSFLHHFFNYVNFIYFTRFGIEIAILRSRVQLAELMANA
ncbi:hypothetical protein MTR67_044591, partial [Solanum verrucosum]